MIKLATLLLLLTGCGTEKETIKEVAPAKTTQQQRMRLECSVQYTCPQGVNCQRCPNRWIAKTICEEVPVGL